MKLDLGGIGAGLGAEAGGGASVAMGHHSASATLRTSDWRSEWKRKQKRSLEMQEMGLLPPRSAATEPGWRPEWRRKQKRSLRKIAQGALPPNPPDHPPAAPPYWRVILNWVVHPANSGSCAANVPCQVVPLSVVEPCSVIVSPSW